MKWISRRAFNRLAALSSLLCLATVAAWFFDFIVVALTHSTPSLIVGLTHHDLVIMCESRPFFTDDKFGHRHGLGLGDFQLTEARSLKTGNLTLFASIPLQYIFAFCLPLPILWLAEMRKRSLINRWRAEGRCLKCGYDLRATPERCPECGTIPPKKETIST
jgi:hypothetical protein